MPHIHSRLRLLVDQHRRGNSWHFALLQCFSIILLHMVYLLELPPQIIFWHNQLLLGGEARCNVTNTSKGFFMCGKTYFEALPAKLNFVQLFVASISGSCWLMADVLIPPQIPSVVPVPLVEKHCPKCKDIYCMSLKSNMLSHSDSRMIPICDSFLSPFTNPSIFTLRKR